MNQWIPWLPAAVDLLGYAALVLVLLAFSLRSLVALRSVAIASNVTFIAYAGAAHLLPVLVLHAALLPINLWRPLAMRHRAIADRAASRSVRT